MDENEKLKFELEKQKLEFEKEKLEFERKKFEESSMKTQLPLNNLEEKSKIKNFVEQFKNYKNVALLCSEHTTEKCHRRLVSDMLLKYFSNDIKFAKHLK